MCLNPRLLFRPERAKRYIFVPCQKCVECKQRRTREWAFRLWYEYEASDKKAEMITLTYNDENLPLDEWNLPTLCKKDYQDFLKRLRKHFNNKKIRYFMCGEYGAKRFRPHFHFIIFGIKFDDKVYFKTDNKGFPVYRSATLEKLWKKVFRRFPILILRIVAMFRFICKKQVEARKSMLNRLIKCLLSLVSVLAL